MFGREDEESIRDYMIIVGAQPEICVDVQATPQTAAVVIGTELATNPLLAAYDGFQIFELVEYLTREDLHNRKRKDFGDKSLQQFKSMSFQEYAKEFTHNVVPAYFGISDSGDE